jgi:putative transposase
MSLRKRTQRRPLSLVDWPGLDERALPEPGRSTFRARRRAVELYSKGATLERIAADTGLHRAALFRLIDRALCPHADGKLWGYRALVPHERVQTYERTAAPRVLVHDKAGNAGVFTQLLQRHPSLAKQLRAEATSGRVYLQVLRFTQRASHRHEPC